MEDEKIISLYVERSEDAITETDKKYGANAEIQSLTNPSSYIIM